MTGYQATEPDTHPVIRVTPNVPVWAAIDQLLDLRNTTTSIAAHMWIDTVIHAWRTRTVVTPHELATALTNVTIADNTPPT